MKDGKAAASMRDSRLKYTDNDFSCLCPCDKADMKDVNVTPKRRVNILTLSPTGVVLMVAADLDDRKR